MAGDLDRTQAAESRHWSGNRQTVLWLTGLWLGVTFVPPLFALDLTLEAFGGPFPVWLLAQAAPVVYVLIVWGYERRMDRLDRELRNLHGD